MNQVPRFRWSLERISWSPLQVGMSISQGVSRMFGDLNLDDCVDLADLRQILAEIRNSGRDDPFLDLNEDGALNIADARRLVTFFSEPRGRPCGL